MEQSVEIRIRRVTRDRYDIVLLRDTEVAVEHGVTFEYVLDGLRVRLGSRLFKLRVGGSIYFRSKVKSM